MHELDLQLLQQESCKSAYSASWILKGFSDTVEHAIASDGARVLFHYVV